MEQSKFYQIKNVTEHEYTLVGCDGSVITRPIRDIDKSASAFTIEDAKDGDVLASDDDGICIFDGTLEEGKYPFAYCGITKRGFDYYDVRLPFSHDNNIHPATKEQRDTLEKAMADAGYTFDFKKKELKKIEQNSIEPDNLIEESYQQQADDLIDMVTEKPAWSEEDEKMCQDTIDWFEKKVFPYALEHENPARANINWLKSLKNRAQPQPKQEWSALDEKNLQGIIDEIQVNKNHAPDYDIATYDRFLKWLKSLRPQNTTVTDEELAQAKKDAYNDVLNKIEYHSGEPTFDDGWSAAIWYLKKRNAQPQNTWKPSDEQMEALEHFIVYHNGSTNYAKDLEELRLQLKKLREK